MAELSNGTKEAEVKVSKIAREPSGHSSYISAVHNLNFDVFYSGVKCTCFKSARATTDPPSFMCTAPTTRVPHSAALLWLLVGN